MTTVSLFCGAGGESAGKARAMAELGLTPEVSHAVNHWNLAVQVHGKNFPTVQVHQEDITQVTAADFGLTRISLLWASPSCVHHSRARGGLPKSDQQRSHADEVVDRWLRVADVDVVLVENVPEFAEWGPLDDDGQVIKARKGEFFRDFLADLEGLGYKIEWRILCAADYGDPTTRRRFFLQAVKDGTPITWPEPSHRNPKKPIGLFDPDLPPWRTAAECIDWSIQVPSIFDRKKPLAEKTLRRIAAGIHRYVLTGKPYIVNFRGTGDTQVDGSASGVDEPVRTISSGGIHAGLVAPTLIQYHSEMAGGRARGQALDAPIQTLDTSNRYGLVAAFLTKFHFGSDNNGSMDDPMPTVTAGSWIKRPGGAAHGLGMVAANLIGIDNASSPSVWPADSPLSTSTTKARHALVAAFLTHYYGTGVGSSPEDPLDTVTTKHRHGLVIVEIDGQDYAIVDIGLRMLEPHELAKAMGFPEGFRFEREDGGALTKADKVKMIGNACPVGTVAALIRNVLAPRVGRYRRVA